MTRRTRQQKSSIRSKWSQSTCRTLQRWCMQRWELTRRIKEWANCLKRKRRNLNYPSSMTCGTTLLTWKTSSNASTRMQRSLSETTSCPKRRSKQRKPSAKLKRSKKQRRKVRRCWTRTLMRTAYLFMELLCKSKSMREKMLSSRLTRLCRRLLIRKSRHSWCSSLRRKQSRLKRVLYLMERWAKTNLRQVFWQSGPVMRTKRVFKTILNSKLYSKILLSKRKMKKQNLQ